MGNPGEEGEKEQEVTVEVLTEEPDCLMINVGPPAAAAAALPAAAVQSADDVAEGAVGKRKASVMSPESDSDDSDEEEPDPEAFERPELRDCGVNGYISDDTFYIQRNAALNGQPTIALSDIGWNRFPPEERAKFFPVADVLPRLKGPNWLCMPRKKQKTARVPAADRNRRVSAAMTPVIRELNGLLPAGSVTLQTVLRRLEGNRYRTNKEVMVEAMTAFEKNSRKIQPETFRSLETVFKNVFGKHYEPVLRPTQAEARRIARNLDKSKSFVGYFEAHLQEYKYAEFFADPDNYIEALAGARAEDMKAYEKGK